MLQKIKDCPHLPIHADIFNPHPTHLPPWCLIWKKTANFATQPPWKYEWESKDVPKYQTPTPKEAVVNPQQIQDWPRPLFGQTSQVRQQPKPTAHIVERSKQLKTHLQACPLQRLKGGLVTLHTGDQEATTWLKDFSFAK